MSNRLPVEKIVNQVATNFEQLAEIHGAVNWKQEASYALQILEGNKYLRDVAMQNPASLQNAVINVAAIGLSLNPVHARAYLVPRDKKVCLDPSFRGCIFLAVDTGAVLWVQGELVYANDTFKPRGPGEKPIHEFEPFKDRGHFVGAYVVAKTKEGDFLTTIMTAGEIDAIKERSSGWKAYKKSGTSTPWVTDYTEMAKKTVIKRAFKTWPMTEKIDRLSRAIDLSNDTDGINLKEEPETDRSAELKAEIEKHLERIGRSMEKFSGYLERIFKKEVNSLDELTEPELQSALNILSELPSKKEGSSEVA